MTPSLDFCCPQCRGALDHNGDEYSCVGCGGKYPIVLGIPDFRVFPDPYIDYADDYKKAEYLAERSKELDFKGLVELYWKITPEVSKERSDRFIRGTLRLIDQGFENLKQIETLRVKHQKPELETVLEIGCGTGGFLVAAKEKFRHAIGIDIAFRWLVVARKRLEELGLEVPLVCCCAEHLPFSDEQFDLVVAEDVLEHVKDQEMVLRESYRVLNKSGALFLATTNRYSINPEPHVRLWGVGFLPRKWMKGYVRLVKGISYDHIKLLSYVELKNLLKRCAFTDEEIYLPSISSRELKNFSTFEKIQVAIYDVVRKTPLIRLLLYLFGPFFHAISFAEKN